MLQVKLILMSGTKTTVMVETETELLLRQRHTKVYFDTVVADLYLQP